MTGSETTGIELLRSQFRVVMGATATRLVIWSDDFVQELIPQISIDTGDGLDRVVRTDSPQVEEHGAFQRIVWTERSTGWFKRYRVDVYDGHVLFAVDVDGCGEVDVVRYFDSIQAEGFREHFALTKHFNDRGRTTAREYATGSSPGFTTLLCPEPTSHARQLFAAHEYAQISVNADLDYHGGNFVANPPLLAFAVTRTQRQWWAVGLATAPGRHVFSELEYHGGTGFALHVNYWGAHRVEQRFSPPGVILVPAEDSTEALARYVRALTAMGLVGRPARRDAAWWHRPVVSGWGHQAWQGDLFRIRSSPERGRDNAVYTLCTQVNYRDIVARVDHADLPWGTLVVDARWFQSGGLKDIDVGRWPDLAGFVAEQHRAGRKVLLWWGPWDAEGVSPDECIRWFPQAQLHANRPGRLAKFGAAEPGAKLGVDISLPSVRGRIVGQVHRLLGSGPGCVDADGLKIDHQAAAPGLYGMVFPEGSARLVGVEAAHEIQRVIYEAAKQVKPDALIVGQSPNPYFSDVQDMVRLGDIYAHRADSVLEEMTFRARMATTADPTVLIDTDGWPLPSLQAWCEYAAAQTQLGVPSLYYVSHLDTTGEALTDADFALLRRVWRRI